ncbi:hypothetical protein PG2029B_1224 [Bifidobacterium pseudolongum subsp. globosum]|uniref:Uncharacterized protein n=1 Tax=Bifidobacterium pseudolongum subsp. globosum TaxID=1690 RepID=A0A4Q5AFU4_9BIFI|nr:hypothetical protein [Bifidobacterium pseudolongum]RYQ26627.1 hypothetical protein PG2032B_1223 [Bifidobacterium pseudolongum subsp. globosum]RYQ28619.1 hypothetical protein PG2029B_1224 [Bifidobacterium pseudolongum subsp. globosum]
MREMVRAMGRRLSKFARPTLRTTLAYLCSYGLVCFVWWLCVTHGVFGSAFSVLDDPFPIVNRTSLWILIPIPLVLMLGALYVPPWECNDWPGAIVFGLLMGMVCVAWSALNVWMSVGMLTYFVWTAGALTICAATFMLRLAWRSDDLRDAEGAERACMGMNAEKRLHAAHAALFNDGWEKLDGLDRFLVLRALSEPEAAYFGLRGRFLVMEGPLETHGVMWEFVDGRYCIVIDRIGENDDRTELALVVIALIAFSYLHATGNGVIPSIESDDAPEQVGKFPYIRRYWRDVREVVSMMQSDDVEGDLGVTPLNEVALQRALRYATHEIAHVSALGRP